MIPNQPIGQPIEHPQATAVLVLGVLSLLCCGLTGPVAWALGRRALNQIEESGGAIGGHSQVLIGYILGIIGTVLMTVMGILFFMTLLNS